MGKDNIGDRMKIGYEHAIEIHLLKRCPVVIRLDGKKFTNWTKGMERPYDALLSDCMISACVALSEEMQGFKLAYTQSDEASFFISDYDTLETEGWFGYDRDKIISVAASTFTAEFNKVFLKNIICKNASENSTRTDILDIIRKYKMATFDCRAFNVPKDDVANYFLWRCKDWHRNSLSMYARSFFSHKELYEKNTKDVHEMLHKIGKNWTTDVSKRFKNGTFLNKDNEGNLIISHDATTHDAIYNVIMDCV